MATSLKARRLSRLTACAAVVAACQPARQTPRADVRTATDAPAAATPPVAGTVSVPAVHPVLVDPRLARVHSLAAAHAWPEAARAMGEAETALRPDLRTPLERCGWSYVAGRLLLAANDPAGAARAFDRARGVGEAGPPCPLAPYAAYRAADAYLRAGDPAAATERAHAAEEAATLRDDAELVIASALAALGRVAEAVPRWRAAVAKNPKVWIDVALPLATALLDGAEGDPPVHALEAWQLATRVVVEAPRIAESSGAEALRTRARARMRERDPAPPDVTVAQRVQQGRAWLDAGEPAKAAALVGALLAEKATPTEPSAYCAASVLRAQALGRTKAGAGTAWEDAIARCEHDPALVTALFGGGKAAQSRQPDVARARFARVEAEFHDHRLADDARFLGALVALGQGDETTFTSMMTSLPDDYPTGDQRTEALFRVALLRMARGDWATVAPLLERIVDLSPDDQHWATAGRAEYFLARAAAALGHVDAARAGYGAVVARHPLSYYMAQSYARLSADRPELATEALTRALTLETGALLVSRTHPEFETPAWARGLSLLEVGDIGLARRELSAAGATRDDADAEVAWVVALAYDQAGAPEIGHSLARLKLRDYLSHYPEGAWRTKWEVAYPRAFGDLVVESSRANHIPTALTWAIMREESDFVAEARSSSNAFGLMQLIIPTAKGVAHELGLPFQEAALKEPRISVALGTRLLAELRSSFPENRALAIAAYNGGGGAVSRWLRSRPDAAFDLWVEEIPWEETRGYVKRVLSSELAYAYLYEPATLDEVLRTPVAARGSSATATSPTESLAAPTEPTARPSPTDASAVR